MTNQEIDDFFEDVLGKAKKEKDQDPPHHDR